MHCMSRGHPLSAGFNHKKKRYISVIFLFNLIVQKQNMLQIPSNFRISLDLFEWAPIGTNYGLNTADETITVCNTVYKTFSQ